jgi:hypothetical protein
LAGDFWEDDFAVMRDEEYWMLDYPLTIHFYLLSIHWKLFSIHQAQPISEQ